MKVLRALRTPDDAWRVEIVQQGQRVFYRLVHGAEVRDKLPIGVLEDILRVSGVSMADLVEIETVAPPG